MTSALETNIYSGINNSAQQKAVDAIEAVPKIYAFASSKSIVDKVPALQQMRDAMDAAPVGTNVIYGVGTMGSSNTPIVRVYTKSGNSSWKWQEFAIAVTGNVIPYGGSNSASGWFKPLWSMYDVHYKGIGSNSPILAPHATKINQAIKQFYSL